MVDRETRKPLPAGEVGEILVRGLLTPGYYRDPEKNAAAFDADGFLLTGRSRRASATTAGCASAAASRRW